MSENWSVQISPKIGDVLVNVRGNDPQEVLQTLEFLADNAVEIGQSLGKLTGAGNVGAAFPQSQQVTSSPAPQGPAPQVPAAPTPAPVQPSVEADKWGRQYEWGNPGAPITPFGQAVLFTGESRQGGTYQQWLDPRAKKIPSNYAKGIRQDPQDVWGPEWVNSR